jgi:hypothetical protein
MRKITAGLFMPLDGVEDGIQRPRRTRQARYPAGHKQAPRFPDP